MTPNNQALDCIVIGYNETPFDRYEQWLRSYGEDSEAYRDLKFSFVEVAGEKLDYVGLLNHAYTRAHPDRAASHEPFKSCDIPNLAAVYLMHYLRRHGFGASYINLFQFEKAKLEAELKRNPLCVAMTTTFYVTNQPVTEMVEFVRSVNDKVKIVVGGPLIANHARNYQKAEYAVTLADLGADLYVVEGQGEDTLRQIVAALKTGQSWETIANIAYFENGQLRETPPRLENNDLNANHIDWLSLAESRPGPTLQTRTARSCAFSCAFCNYPTRAGKLVTSGLETVEAELDSMKALGQVENLVFIDDTFNVPIRRFKDICRLMIRKNYGFNWFSYFRCSNADQEAVELMAESGCKGVFLGIESGSPTILENMNKHAKIEKYTEAIKWLHAHDILTFGSFILGFPGETEATVGETIAFINETRPDFYRTQLWYNEPGTPIQARGEQFGIRGEGFVWEHNTMESLEAMDHIERIFLTVAHSTWLPQWSFDFWIIPYLMGRGISLKCFSDLMAQAHRMLTLEIAEVSPGQKKNAQQQYLDRMVAIFAEQPQTTSAQSPSGRLV